MGTRAVYTFKDSYNTHHVYKHYDGYPRGEGAGAGALGAIEAAKEYAWDLPRFEASDFSAAFVAANKSQGGGNVYLTDGYEYHSDLEYRYEIEKQDDKLLVKVFKVEGYDDSDNPKYELIEEIFI
jgi:hypothetical protein